MASSSSFDEIQTVRELLTKPLVLEVFDGLGRNVAPGDAVPADADPEVLEEALQYLRRMGVIEVDAQPGQPARNVNMALTARGRDLLRALQHASWPDDLTGPLPQTSAATETSTPPMA